MISKTLGQNETTEAEKVIYFVADAEVDSAELLVANSGFEFLRNVAS